MAEITTRNDRALGFATRFRSRLAHTPYWTKGWPHLHLPPAAETYALLASLGENPDPDGIDAIMAARPTAGKGITYADCDECGAQVAVVATFDINCGEFTIELCETCCRRIADDIAKRS